MKNAFNPQRLKYHLPLSRGPIWGSLFSFILNSSFDEKRVQSDCADSKLETVDDRKLETAAESKLDAIFDLSQHINETVEKLWVRITGKDYLDPE